MLACKEQHGGTLVAGGGRGTQGWNPFARLLGGGARHKASAHILDLAPAASAGALALQISITHPPSFLPPPLLIESKPKA